MKHSQGTIMESRVFATATSSNSHSDRGDLASSHNAGLSSCSSPMSNGASSSACSTTGSNHSDTCNGPNGVCDGKNHFYITFAKYSFDWMADKLCLYFGDILCSFVDFYEVVASLIDSL